MSIAALSDLVTAYWVDNSNSLLTSADRGPSRTQNSRGFTVLELLVVVAIIALLAALILPALFSARARAHVADNLEKLRQIGQAAALYEQHEGRCPLRLSQLVDSRLIPKSLCRSELDPETMGMRNVYVKQLSAGQNRPEWLLPYKVSFIGLGEVSDNWDTFDREIRDRAGAGWLIDLTSTRPGIASSYGLREGTYRRLLLDGAVVQRKMFSVNCGGVPCRSSLSWFRDDTPWSAKR